MLAGGFYERTSGAAGQALGHTYQRRAPEHTVLHELVSRHAQTLIAELRDADGCGLPASHRRQDDRVVFLGTDEDQGSPPVRPARTQPRDRDARVGAVATIQTPEGIETISGPQRVAFRPERVLCSTPGGIETMIRSPPASLGTTSTGITGTTPRSLSVRREAPSASGRRCVRAIRRDRPRCAAPPSYGTRLSGDAGANCRGPHARVVRERRHELQRHRSEPHAGRELNASSGQALPLEDSQAVAAS